MLVHRSFAPISSARSEMEQLFNGMFSPFGFLPRRDYSTPHDLPLNVWEDDQSIHVEVEIPGVRAEDLDITGSDDEVSIKGQWSNAKDMAETWHRQERREGDFARVLKMPVKINVDEMKASLTHGVLRLTLPKAMESQPRKIEIKTNK